MPKKDIMKMDLDELLQDYREERRDYMRLKYELEAYEEHYDLKRERLINYNQWAQYINDGGIHSPYSEELLFKLMNELYDDILKERREIRRRREELEELRQEIWRKYRRLLELWKAKTGKKKGNKKSSSGNKKKGGKKKKGSSGAKKKTSKKKGGKKKTAKKGKGVR